MIFLFSLKAFPVLASSEIENFDIRYYHPANYGLKDLVFEVRVKNLLESLNRKLSLGRVVDVHFKIYWMLPGKYKIEVAGLPKGFKELKSELRNMIKNRLDFVIPQKLAPRVRSYSLTRKKLKNEVNIIAKDKTHTRLISEIRLKFNKKGMLKSLKTLSPAGVNNSLMKMTAKSWSHNKWLIDVLTVNKTQGVQKTSMKYKIDYLSIDGLGFPKKISILTTQELLQTRGAKSKKNERKVESEIIFSKYEINSGKAKRFIVKGLRH